MKKTLSLVIAILFILSIVPFSVFASEKRMIDFTMGASLEGGKLVYDASNGRSVRLKNYYGSFPTTGRFYDQLTAQQKVVYDALLNSDVTAEAVNVTFSDPIVIDASDSDWTGVSDVVFTAFNAFSRDNPVRFWYYGSSWSSTSAWYTDSTYSKIAVGGISVTIGFYPSYSASTIQSVYNQLLDEVAAFTPAGVTRYEKVRSIHDYLITKATYDPDYNNSNAAPYGHQPTGCLLSPNLCVCEGYAESFKIFADLAGIPNMLVSSQSHIWNVVLMEDNKWYAVDCTWDDPMMGNISYSVLQYDYFLVGSQTVPNGASEAFSANEDHIEEYVYTDSKGNSLLNPTLSASAYAPFYPKYTYHTNGVQGNDYPGGSILQSKKLVFLAPGKTVANCFDYSPPTGSVTASKSSTGSSLIFTTTSGVATTYTIIMYGDVSKDAKVNTTDINALMNVAVGKAKYSAASPESYAGDVNGDGVIDAFDLAVVDRYLSGNYSFY